MTYHLHYEDDPDSCTESCDQEPSKCDCPWDKSHCPHCGKDLIYEHVVGFGKQGHRDRCHKAALGVS